MEKTIYIDNRAVTFKSTGAFLLRYKAQFRRDALKDLVKLEPIIQKIDEAGTESASEMLEALDLDLFYNICWTMAKSADKTIPEPLEWLDSFGEFPVLDIIADLMDVLTASISVSKKK